MATLITKYQATDGTEFNSAEECNAYEQEFAKLIEIKNFVSAMFPPKELKEGEEPSNRANPHFSTAVRAITLWDNRAVA